MNRNNIDFKIVKHVCLISVSESCWTKELNKISWNGNEPKWDLRAWSPDHTRMSHGIALTDEEMAKLLASCINANVMIDLPVAEQVHGGDESDN